VASDQAKVYNSASWMNDLPIGVFDSGIGGLTVLKELIKRFPRESFIYLGDTARVPYGTRDKETIKRFSIELVDFLLKQKVKALVVACNTMSSVALSEIKNRSTVPVIDVISPTVKLAAKNARDKIGIIGTRATINSRAYEKAFQELGVKIEARECPLFVPLIEEGVIDSKATEIIAKTYLDGLKVDYLVLGCTHYPLLSKVIQKVIGKKVRLIDSAHPTADALRNLLSSSDLSADSNIKPSYKFYVTDDTKKTEEVARLFFDNKLPAKLQKVTV
jgi:glutamate racemase